MASKYDMLKEAIESRAAFHEGQAVRLKQLRDGEDAFKNVVQAARHRTAASELRDVLASVECQFEEKKS